MTTDSKNPTLEELIDKASVYIKDESSIDLIKKVYDYAFEKHQGQLRKSGEEYIVHPLCTAIILTSVYSDCATICAGLLHDVIEDCDTSKDEIENMFGEEIANLVYGVTKITKIHFSTENEALIEYYKKIIVGMSEDVRVIIIKLADRLHNMRTLWALPLPKQKLKAKETLEILAPIAHHLGIYKLKSELEDLALRYLKPDVFYDIAEKLNITKLERDNEVKDMIDSVSELLKEHNIPHELKGRSKSIYSIYRKLEKGRKFSDIYDLLALRIFVNSEQECYTALGIIHSKYRPIPKRFKDYIAMPKVNGYRSLHTTVFGIDGYLFEIQIRTYEMDEIAENGLAAHWSYKENKNLADTVQTTTDAKLQLFKSIIELNEEKMSSEEFVNSVKNELLNDNIYVFTPKGDVFELPKGATPIDFAYRVHSKIGETTVGALVNNNIVPLNYTLNDNDIVKIITNKNSPGPSKEWLKFVKSTQTKSKIKSFFSRNEKEKYIEKGKTSLEKELRRKKISFNEFLSDENINKILKDTKLNDLEELYLTIGNNKYSSSYIIGLIYKSSVEQEKNELKDKNLNKDDNIVFVEGIDKVKVNIANCCNPIPGDDIIGYITRVNGITVHRSNCPNLENMDNRLINVRWNDNNSRRFLTSIVIYSKSNDKAMIEIMQKANSMNVLIDGIKVINKTSDIVTYQLDVLVYNIDFLNNFIKELLKYKYITDVTRFIR